MSPPTPPPWLAGRLRSLSLKLRGSDTADSVMMFEETLPAGAKSVFHLHHDSDEVAYVLRGEVTFMIDGKVTVGVPRNMCLHAAQRAACVEGRRAEIRHVLFLYTPAKAGGLIEEQQRTGWKFAMMGKEEMDDILDRHG